MAAEGAKEDSIAGRDWILARGTFAFLNMLRGVYRFSSKEDRLLMIVAVPESAHPKVATPSVQEIDEVSIRHFRVSPCWNSDLGDLRRASTRT